MADTPVVFATFHQKLLFRRGEMLIFGGLLATVAILSRRNAHFHLSTSSTGLSCINATFKNKQTALTIRQFWQLDQACNRQDPTIADKLIASCLIKSTLSSNDCQIQKVLFCSRMEHFLMQPTSGGPSGPSVAQNYCIFTAKVCLGCQKPEVFTTF